MSANVYPTDLSYSYSLPAIPTLSSTIPNTTPTPTLLSTVTTTLQRTTPTIPFAREALTLSGPTLSLSTIHLPPSTLSIFLVTELDAVIVYAAGPTATTARMVGEGGTGDIMTVSAGIPAATVAGSVGVGTTGVVHMTSAGFSGGAAKTGFAAGDGEGQKVVLVVPASRDWGAWSQGQRDGVMVVGVLAGLALMAVAMWGFWRNGERRRRMKERQMGWDPSSDYQRSSRSSTSMRKKLQGLNIFKKSPAKAKDESGSEGTIEGLETIEVGPAARRAFWEDLTTAGDHKGWESGIAMSELGGGVLNGEKPTKKQKKVRIDGVTVIHGSHEGDEDGDPFKD